MFLAVAITASCAEKRDPPPSQATAPGAGDWEAELQSEGWPVFGGRQLLQVDPNATEVVFLFGAFNNGRLEENIRIQKVGDKVALDAWWMTWRYPIELLALHHTMTEDEIKDIWTRLDAAGAFQLTDQSRQMSHAMTYWLKVGRGGKTHRAKVYGIGWRVSTTVFGDGGKLDPGWERTVFAILSLRDKFAHLIRPVAFAKDGSVDLAVEPRGIVVADDLVTKKLAGLKDPSKLTPEQVLQLGGHRNREIVESLVSLLDHADAGVRGAAGAALSWCSGNPASPDPAVWKQWWKSAKGRFEPTSTPWPFEGRGESGVIRRLGGGVSGFIDAEIDAEGVVWALAEVEGDWSGRTYRVYRLDKGADRFTPTDFQGRYGNKGDVAPPVSFVRRVTERKIAFPDYYQSVWVSPDAKWGAAILGQQTKYYSDSVVVLDFERGSMSKPFRTTHQYGDPVVSADGRHVAVAKGWNWANPNVAAVIDTTSGVEKEIPVPAAGDLGPIAFLEDSPKGRGFYLLRNEDRWGNPGGPDEIWWCDPSGARAEKLVGGGADSRWSIVTPAILTQDGRQILVRRRHGEGRERTWTTEWRAIPEGIYRPALPSSVSPRSTHASPDGHRVIFVHEGQVFEWTDR